MTVKIIILNTFFISLHIYIHEWLYHYRMLTKYQRAHIIPYSIWIQYEYKFPFLQTTIRSKAVDSFSLLGMNYVKTLYRIPQPRCYHRLPAKVLFWLRPYIPTIMWQHTIKSVLDIAKDKKGERMSTHFTSLRSVKIAIEEYDLVDVWRNEKS